MPEPRPNPVPIGRTAQRLTWPFLPPHVRALVEERCGSAVVDAASQGGGFTPGFASVLTCADGTKHFVKAASAQAQPVFADSYREEARKLGALPEGVAGPRLLWSSDDDWVVLGIEHVEGRLPRRPWSRPDLDRVLGALEETARLLTPAPPGLGLDTFAAEFASFGGMWATAPRGGSADLVDSAPPRRGRGSRVALRRRDRGRHPGPHRRPRRQPDPGHATAARGSATGTGPSPAPTGSTRSSCSSRREATATTPMRCWPPLPLTRDVPDESIDIVLALVTGYFLRQARQPSPPTSPYLRPHQQWQGEVCWDWLCERRGWSASLRLLAGQRASASARSVRSCLRIITRSPHASARRRTRWTGVCASTARDARSRDRPGPRSTASYVIAKSPKARRAPESGTRVKPVPGRGPRPGGRSSASAAPRRARRRPA